jgi:hypothetical protein
VTTMSVEAAYLERLAASVEKAAMHVRKAQALLDFKSNKHFITTRGRTALALDNLTKAEEHLLAALVPFAI